ncbi:MAG: hypothetical protein JNK00_10865 [Flavipsychrobacter sp.]|nr:hypothetical protein [Flavipsychrobacter sp.]
MKGIITGTLCISALLISQQSMAQGSGANSLNINSFTPPTKSKPVVKKIKPLRKEFSIGLRLNSDGWGVFVDKGWVKSQDRQSDLFYDTRVFQVELAEKHHPKEIKRTNTLGSFATENPTPFVFGKVNNFYALKLGYGNRKMIAGKPESGTVSVHWVYLGGLSLGLLKPYYINIVAPGTSAKETIKYSEATKNDFLYQNGIVGAAGFSKGIGEVNIVPGIHAKTALHFDFAASRHSKLAIETGINIEYYTGKVMIMANQADKSFFTNVYASIQFGRRK